MDTIELYTDKEFKDKLQEIMRNVLVGANPTIQDCPTAFLLGGQSGAGKTNLHRILSHSLQGDVIVINGDAYRKFHPHFYELQAAYGDEAVKYTASWAGQMVEALIDAFSSIGYNLIIEGTLRTTEAPTKTATFLRERGYDVSLALMAVKPEISLVSCQLRYEEMRLLGTTPRAVDPNHHRLIVDQIVENLSTLEQSGLFDSIQLYTRSGECIFPSDDSDSCKQTASDVLREKLFGSWTSQEHAHLEMLETKLEELKSQ